MNEFEEAVKYEFVNAFIFDTVYLNPFIKGTSKEYCDLFIDYFDDAVIVQCKECSSKNEERLTKKTLVDGLNQLRSSVNRAKSNSVILTADNELFEEHDISLENKKEIFPILIVNEKVDFLDYASLKDMYPELNKLNFFPLIATIADLKYIMKKLDTPKDFFRYLEQRSEFLQKASVIYANEKELLALYLLTLKTFDLKKKDKPSISFVDNPSNILENGEVSKFFKEKEKADEISYWLDDILRRMFLGNDPNYLVVAKELSGLNRMERRIISESALEKSHIAFTENRDSWRVIRLREDSELGFVFFFSRKKLKNRRDKLETLMMSAQYKTNIPKIIGISQEPFLFRNKPKVYFDCVGYLECTDTNTNPKLDKMVDEIWGSQYSTDFHEFPHNKKD